MLVVKFHEFWKNELIAVKPEGEKHQKLDKIVIKFVKKVCIRIRKTKLSKQFVEKIVQKLVKRIHHKIRQKFR